MGYSNVEVYGGANINYLHVKNNIDTEDEIKAVVDSGLYIPVWDEETYMLATYQNNIEASSVDLEGMGLIGYKIQRYDTEEDALYPITDTEMLKIRDYNVASNSMYKYYIYPIVNKGNNTQVLYSPIITREIKPQWDGCSIVGLKKAEYGDKTQYVVDTENIWSFRYNIEQQDCSLNMDKEFRDGFGRFPKLNRGQKRYLTSGMQSLVGEVDCKESEFKTSFSKIEKWEDFCYSSNLKLFKDMNGRVVPCDIKDVAFSYLMNGNDSPIATSFSIVQLGDRKEISVYEEVL